MDTRKVQKVGASTLSVSLPKEWVERHGIDKGDIVLLEAMRDGALRVQPQPREPFEGPERTTWVIDADQCDQPGLLERVVVGCYIIGRDALRIESKGALGDDHLAEVRKAVAKLRGLVIMREERRCVELQCAIDPSRFPLETVLKRLYNVGATMQREAVDALARREPALAESAIRREDEADAMYWLTLRLLLTAQTDPQLAEKIGLTEQLPIVGNRLIAKSLEHVADYAEHAARNALAILGSGAHVPDDLVRRYQRVGRAAGEIVNDALAAIMGHDIQRANRALLRLGEVEAEEERLLGAVLAVVDDPAEVGALRAIAWSLRRIAEHGAEIAYVGINRYLERPSGLARPEAP